MSKDNSSDEFSSKYIDFLINKIDDVNASLQAISNNYKESLKEQRKSYEHLIDAYNKGDISSKQIVKAIEKSHKTTQSLDYNIQRTATYNAGASKFYTELIKVIDNRGKVTEELLDKIESAITNMDSTALVQSYKENEKGTKDALFKNVQDNSKLKEVNKDLAEKIGANTESFRYKLESFFGNHFKESKKTLMAFGADLIEGLAKNKFIGGALHDVITIFGLLGANWLRNHFGALGSKIGAGFFALTQVIAGLLPTLIIGGIANILTGGKLFGILTKAFKASFGAIGSLFRGFQKARTMSGLTQTPWGLKDWSKFQALAKGGVKAGTLAKVGVGALKGAGGLAAGFALDAGADFAVKKGVDARLARGLSGAGQGAITGAFLSAWIPIIGPAVGAGVGAAIGGITGIIKGFREESKDHNKAMEDDAREKKSWWQNLWDLLKNIGEFFGLKKNRDSSPSVDNRDGVAGSVRNWWDKNVVKQDTKTASTLGKLALNEAGGVINVRSMNKMQASDAARQYMSANPTQFNRAYETVGSKYAYVGSFENDWALRDKSGKAQQAILYKGAGQDLEYLWNSLVAGGMDRKKAEMLKYTSGRSTASSVHKKGGANSHDNIMNMVTDLGVANQWSDAEWKMAFETLKPLMAAQGFDLKWEGKNKQGKTIYGDKFVGGLSNRHFHVALAKGSENLRPSTADENVNEYRKQQEAIAQQHSIEAEGLLSRQNPEALNKIKGQTEGKTSGEVAKALEKELKNYGITYDPNNMGSDDRKGRWIVKGQQSGDYYELLDPSGNRDFMHAEIVVQQISNYGV